MKPPALQIHDLQISLSGAPILQNISLEIPRGDYLSIIGPNGAGKSTLIKCICGIHTTWSGTLKLEGRDLRRIPPRNRARLLSYVPQAMGRMLPFTAFEFVLMARYPHLSPFTSITKADKTAAEKQMELAGVLDFKDRSLDTLSGGERQLVFIAAALTQGAQILLLDEPTAFLDYRHQIEVQRLLSHLHKEKQLTLITVSHNLQEACSASQHLLAIKSGKQAFYGSPDELLNSAKLEEIFDTSFTILDHPHKNEKLILAEGPPV